MNNVVMKCLRITLVVCVVLGIFYVALLSGFAKIFGPGKGNAETVTLNGEIVGVANVGQVFTEPVFFWGRPSAVDYSGDASGASNKGPSNEEYLQEVEGRIDEFLRQHPYLQREDVPAEMVTASGSGLDPHITPECAYVQIRRVAEARGLSEKAVEAVVRAHIEKPFLGIFGTSRVNVLKLNVALEEMNPTRK